MSSVSNSVDYHLKIGKYLFKMREPLIISVLIAMNPQIAWGMGSPTHWRTMPWMVTFFGILVIPLGLVHILLVISQPVIVGEWCTLCLLAAAIMLPMIPLKRMRSSRWGSSWCRPGAEETPFGRCFGRGVL